MSVVSPFVLIIGTSTWDLTKVARWMEPSPQTSPTTVNVYFIDTPNTAITFDKTTFETQMQIALNATPS